MAYSQPGIFNLLDYGNPHPNDNSIAQGQANANALQLAINAAQASGNPYGAIVLIPSFGFDQHGVIAYGDWFFAVPSTQTAAINIPAPSMQNAPLLICGTGLGTTLTMLLQTNGDMFFNVTDTQSVTFQDLAVVFDTAGSFKVDGTAFNFVGCLGSRLFRVRITNCRYPVAFNGTQGASMLQCLIIFDPTFPTSPTSLYAVHVFNGSKQTTIEDCLLRWHNGTPLHIGGYYGIYIDVSSGTVISNTQISDFGVGVALQSSGGVVEAARVIASSIEAYGPCVMIGPTVFDAGFLDCYFQANSAYNLAGAGIVVGQAGNQNAQIDTIRFDACNLIGNSGMTSSSSTYGMQINAGQNIQINGGNYSGNGATAGISIVGPAREIQINGANCIGYDVQGHADNPTAWQIYQLYGIYIGAGTDIQLVGVNCSGNGLTGSAGTGIVIEGSVTDVRIVGAICTNPVLGTTTTQQYGIYIAQATGSSPSGILIEGCAVTGNSVSGIYIGSAANLTISGCDLFMNAQGITVDGPSSDIFVRDCNLTGYSDLAGAITFASAGLTNVQVTDCSGYNDQALQLGTAIPTGLFNGVTYANPSYFGPTVFYVYQCLVSVETSSGLIATGLSMGGFTLAPGNSAEITSHNPNSTFVMFGN
jgi:hypothetical protein